MSQFAFNPQGHYGSNQNFMGAPVNYTGVTQPQAFGQGTTQMGNDIMSQYTTQPADLSLGLQAGGDNSGAFGGIGLDQFAAGAGIAKDLYGMYAAHQGLGLAKDQFKEQKNAFNYNKGMRNDQKAANLNAYASVV